MIIIYFWRRYCNNYPFLQNDHLRIFGSSLRYGGYYIITGSCSEESGIFKIQENNNNDANLLIHHFVSFNHCRDLLYKKAKNQEQHTQLIEMNNSYSDGNFTTRDHDGKAVQIVL